VREFYSNLPRPVRVAIEATRSNQWFVNLMEELKIECLVGHPAEIRAAGLQAPSAESAPHSSDCVSQKIASTIHVNRFG
jgi:hypothetical protein